MVMAAHQGGSTAGPPAWFTLKGRAPGPVGDVLVKEKQAEHPVARSAFRGPLREVSAFAWGALCGPDTQS